MAAVLVFMSERQHQDRIEKMDQERTSFLQLAEDTLCFELYSSDVTRVEIPFTTGWRKMPTAVTAQIIDGSFTIDFAAGRSCTIRDGHGLFVAPNIEHRVTLASGSDPVSRWSHVSFTILNVADVLEAFSIPTELPVETAQL